MSDGIEYQDTEDSRASVLDQRKPAPAPADASEKPRDLK